MVFRKSFLFTFALAMCLIMIPTLALALEASRIELKDGTLFENVTFKVDNEYKVISFNYGDDKRYVSFADIVNIFDADGEDITAEVLDREYVPSGMSEKPVEAVGSPVTLSEGKIYPYLIAIHAQPNYSEPFGDFYDGLAAGIGFGADISIPVSRQLALRGTVSRSGIKPDFDLPVGVDFSIWRYVVSVQYYKWPRWRTDGKAMYYLYSGIGGINHTLSVGGQSEDVSKLITVFGFGVINKISETFGIETGVEVGIVFVGVRDGGSSYFGNVERALVLDFKVGLVALL